MNSDLLIVLALLAAIVAMFALNRPRMDAVALIALVALPLTGTIGLDDALAGFADPNVILIAALFVVGEALVRTGVAQHVGDVLIRYAGPGEPQLIALLMVLVAGIGAFMSSTGVVAIFIPIVLRIAAGTGLSPGRLMMPLSVAGLISGMMTLVATAPNLVVNTQLMRAGHEGFHFFAFTPFGLPVLGLAVLYMLVARRFLARAPARTPAPRPRLADWIESYGLRAREYRMRVESHSPWVGKRLDMLDLRASAGVNVLGVERGQGFARKLIWPTGETELRADDVLFLDIFDKELPVSAFCAQNALRRLPVTGEYFTDQSQEIGMVEVMVPPDSDLVGRTVTENRFRSRYGLVVIGLKHGTITVPADILSEELRPGDTLLVIGPWRAIRKLHKDRDLIVLNLPAEADEAIAVPRRAPHAVAILVLMVVMMVSGVVANVQAALIACLLLGLTGCVDMQSAWRSIHWPSLMVIVGMLPFSLALQNTGGVDLVAGMLLTLVGEAGPRAALAAVFVLTVVLGLFISNTATAVLMAPVALAVAGALGASPWPFAMGVALAASASFMTPVSSPVNMLVVGPGGYGFGDFVRIGAPLAVIVLVVTVALVPLVMPF